MEKEINQELTEQWETIGKRFQEQLEPSLKKIREMFDPVLDPLREMWERLSKNLPWVFCNIVLEAIEAGDFEFIDSFVRNGLWIKPGLYESKTRYNSLSLERKGAVEGHSIVMEAALLTWATQDQWRNSNHPLKYIRKIVKKNSTWQDFDVDRIQEGKRYPGSLFHGWGNYKKEPKNCISFDVMSSLGEQWRETDREFWIKDEQEAFIQACYEPQENPLKPMTGHALVMDRMEGIGGLSIAGVEKRPGELNIDREEEEINKYPVPKNEKVKELNREAEYVKSKFIFDGWHDQLVAPTVLPGKIKGKYTSAAADDFAWRKKWITCPELRDNRKCYTGCQVVSEYRLPDEIATLNYILRPFAGKLYLDVVSTRIANKKKSKLEFAAGRIINNPHNCPSIPIIQTGIKQSEIRHIAPIGNVDLLANIFDYKIAAESVFSRSRQGAYYTQKFTAEDEGRGFIYGSFIYHGRVKIKTFAGTFGTFEDDLTTRMDVEFAYLRAGLRSDDIEVALSWDCKPKTKGKAEFAFIHLSRCVCYGGAPPDYKCCGKMVIVDKNWTRNRVNASIQRIKRAINYGRLEKRRIKESCSTVCPFSPIGLSVLKGVFRIRLPWPRIYYRDGRFVVEP